MRRLIQLTLLFTVLVCFQSFGQVIVLGEGPARVNDVCSGRIMDPGGLGNYPNYFEGTKTICASAGNCIRLTFTDFSTANEFDFLTIYDGPSTDGDILLFEAYGNSLTGGMVYTGTSNSGGCLTLEFETDGANTDRGFSADIACVPCIQAPPNIILGESAEFTGCEATIYDPGGTSNYQNDTNATQTFCSGSPQSCVELKFLEYSTQFGRDFVRVYDGLTTSSPLLAELTGPQPGAVVRGTSAGNGCITVNFQSDGSGTGAGFKARMSCVPCQAPARTIVLGSEGRTITCSGLVTDPGGVGGYRENVNVQQTICSGNSECISLAFTDFDTDLDLDFLSVYDGPDNFSQMIGQFSGSTLPPTLVSSTASGGCLTLAFKAESGNYHRGFQANVSCVPCTPPLSIITMGQSLNTVISCGGTVLDPGGFGNYGSNQNVVQTICSGDENCMKIDFSRFATERNIDRLLVFDGSSPDPSRLLGVYSGPYTSTLPFPVSSSYLSQGCITLQFISNSENNNSGFEARISCTPCEDPDPIPSGRCEDSRPFCADQGVEQFPAGTNVESPFNQPVGCLNSSPNPAWYFMNIEQGGTLNLRITGSNNGNASPTNDVDYICWGPFNDRDEMCGVLGDFDYANNPANQVDCSYATDYVEYLTIPNAQAGQWYMVMITNYSNSPTNIYFQSVSGTARTNCNIQCALNLNTTVSTCDPATNTYSVSGSLAIANPPRSGKLNIVNTSGGVIVLDAPFPATYNFNFTNLASNGAQNQVFAYFSDDNNCAVLYDYTAPASCSVCPVEATSSGDPCEGSSVTLSATDIPGASYTWSGPNGFSATTRQASIPGSTLQHSGVYTVTLNNPANSCQSIGSVNVTVKPTPAAPVLSSNSPICEFQPLNFNSSGSTIQGAVHRWSGPGGYTSTLQNPGIDSARTNHSGSYSVVIDADGCLSNPVSINVVVNPAPASPQLSSNGPICAGEDLELNAVASGVVSEYEWRGPVSFSSNLASAQIPNTTPSHSGRYQARVKAAGCYSLYSDIEAIVFPVPERPVIMGDSIYCEGDDLNLSTPDNPNYTFEWINPDGNSSTTNSGNIFVLPTLALSDEGQYSLLVTGQGCTSDTSKIMVQVFPAPAANAGPDKYSCSGEEIVIGSPEVSGFTYSWNPATYLSSAETAQPIVSASNTEGNAKIIDYVLSVSLGSCVVRDTVQVTIASTATPGFTPPLAQCFRDNSFNFKAGGTFSGTASFRWNFGPFATPQFSDEKDPQGITFESTGIHNVSLQIDESGCLSQIYTAPITVYPMPVSNFDADVLSGCEPHWVRFQNKSTSEDPVKSFLWDFGNGRQSTLNIPPVQAFHEPGDYQITLSTTTVNGCVDTYIIPKMIHVQRMPESGFNIEPALVFMHDPRVFISDHSAFADKIEYEIEGQTFTNEYLEYRFRDTGIYEIKQTVFNGDCYDVTTRTVVVQHGYKIYVPTAFTPNSDDKNDRFRAYGEDIYEFKMEIFNRWGELMYQSYDIENGWDGRVRLSNDSAPGGLYIYRIQTRTLNGPIMHYRGTVNLLR